MARRVSRGRLVVDIILIFMTGGLWLLWMLVRFLRSNI